jgi:hypothetical protein
MLRKWINKIKNNMKEIPNNDYKSSIDVKGNEKMNFAPFRLVDVEKKPSKKGRRQEKITRKSDLSTLSKTYFLNWSAKYDKEHPWWVEQEKILGDQLRRDPRFNREFLERVLEWKFKTVPMWRKRNLERLQGVPDSKIIASSNRFFEAADTSSKVNALKLDGIGVSVASVVLTFLDPSMYCIHDTHVWRRVYGGDCKGIHTLNHYLTLLDEIRITSLRVDLPVRTVEKALFKEDFDAREEKSSLSSGY